jgi:hypothetical protein
MERGEGSEQAPEQRLLIVCGQRLSGYSVRQGALTSVVCGFTAGGSGAASTDTINSNVLSTHIAHQINFVPTCVHANRFQLWGWN